MKVTLLYVSSLDCKLTRWGEPNIAAWKSTEDTIHFEKLRDQSKLIVMGSGTFDAVHPPATQGILRVVLTSKPEKYKEFFTPEQLEFSDESPQALVKRMIDKGYQEMLLISGGKVTTAFFENNLIDEIWLTIEPKIFGTGGLMTTESKLDLSLQLLEMKQLNEQGTLLLHYKIIKP